MSLIRTFHLLDNLFINSNNNHNNNHNHNSNMNTNMDMLTNLLPTWWKWPLIVYGGIELSFYFIFHYHLVPRANERTPPQPFRAFGCHDGKDRFMLMRRILDRLERTCAATGEDMFQATAQYLTSWFRFEPHKATGHDVTAAQQHPRPPPMRRVSNIMTDSEEEEGDSSGEENDRENDDKDNENGDDWEPIVPSSSSQVAEEESSSTAAVATTTTTTIPMTMMQRLMGASPKPQSVELMWNDSKLDGCEKSNIFKWALHTLRHDDVNDLLSCFFFGKRVEDMLEWETTELARLFHYLETHFDLKCQPGRSPVCSPRLLTLEDCDAWHRPLAVYAGIYAMQWGKAGALWSQGFSYHVTKTGLPYWHRPAATQQQSSTTAPNPLLFFHGIAPGGSTIYLPMLLKGVANDGRALFIFENAPVSCHPSFDILSEDETIEGVQEALEKFYPQGDIALMGHSFGSFQLTWLIYSPLRDRIRQFVLLDPVSILLSEPDLIQNFEDATPLFKIFLKELWTNYYIRRHFSWYRSELWLDDLPDNVDFFVGLAERDQIVNGPKVRREVDIFGDEHPAFARQTTSVYWENALHGDCVYQPNKWKDIRNFFENTNKQKVC